MKINRLSFAYFLFVIGVVFVSINLQSGIAATRPRVNLYDKDTYIEDIGFFDMVEADIDTVLDSFATESTSRSGIITHTNYYYIIPVTGRDQETYFIAVEVAEDNSVPYDKVVKSTWDYLEGKPNVVLYKVHATGCIKKLSAKKYNFFQEWFEEAGIFETKEDIDKYVLPLYLSNEVVELCTNGLIAGAACLLISVLLIISYIRARWKQKKEVKQLLKERAEKQKFIKIDGKEYPKATFDHVNELCRKSKRQEAMQELCDITGIEKLDAKIIIDNWNEYYYV